MRTNNNIDRGGFPAPRFLHGKQKGSRGSMRDVRFKLSLSDALSAAAFSVTHYSNRGKNAL